MVSTTDSGPVAAENGIPAGYGRSCTNCSRAKCRCILRSEGGSCERCSRLGKECHQIATMRKRVTKKSASSRTAQLEEKIEDLVSMLRANQSSGQSNTQINSQIHSISHSPSASNSYPSRLDSLVAAATADPAQSRTRPRANPSIPFDGAAAGRAYDGLTESDKLAEPSPQEAERYLSKFRVWLKNFPFMHLPADLSAAALKREKPFLWMVIMNLTSMSHPQQLALRERIREEIARRVIMQYDRSMDVLQGLLAYQIWATMNTGPGMKPFFVLYAQLAQTIVFDLALTRSPLEEQQSTMYFKIWSARPLPPPRVRSMDERRAVLALWLSISIATSFVGKMETMSWTSHMDECLEELDCRKDHPDDEILVARVKIQLIGEEAQNLLRRDKHKDVAQNPTYVLKPGLIGRLAQVGHQLPERLMKNHNVTTLLHSTEMLIQTIGLFSHQNMPESFRITSMYSCARSARAFWDEFGNVSPIEVAGLPFAAYVGMSHVQATLYRITTLEDPAWDKAILRNTANILTMLDKAVDLFYRADEVYPVRTEDSDGTLLSKGAKTLKKLRNSWEPILAPYLQEALPTPDSFQMDGTSDNACEPGLDGSMAVDGAALEFNDMTWVSDIFGPWEY